MALDEGRSLVGPGGGIGPRRIQNVRLPPEVNRIIYIRNLPWKISPEEMYDIFGKYGPIRQIRLGNTQQTRGRAYVCYEDIYDAKNAVDHLSGFNVGGRYIVVLYHSKARQEVMNTEKKKADLEKMKKTHGVTSDPTPVRRGENTPGRTPGHTPGHKGADYPTPRGLDYPTPGHTPGHGTPAHTPSHATPAHATPAHATPARGEYPTPARSSDQTPARGDYTPARGEYTPARGEATPARGSHGDATPARADATPARGDRGDFTPARTPMRGDEDE
jgi:pre-mRNA branch site protein p14